MPKSKEQKRAEAIARAARSFIVNNHIRCMSEQEYLDQFRRKCDRSIQSFSELHVIGTVSVYHDCSTP